MSTARDSIGQTAKDLREQVQRTGGRMTQEEAERRVRQALRKTQTDLTDKPG